ncbi:hypothetical protein RJT34_20029 [Clitoria ternatea]|uniref:Uncharacterized protein n=1 Tax=Clitoria ternatea TaxID=43366 RepID=A0AAN9ISK9_CLITE
MEMSSVNFRKNLTIDWKIWKARNRLLSLPSRLSFSPPPLPHCAFTSTIASSVQVFLVPRRVTPWKELSKPTIRSLWHLGSYFRSHQLVHGASEPNREVIGKRNDVLEIFI